jgi:hypothetical protein
VVQDFVGIGLGQSQPLDIGEGLLIGLVILQYRECLALLTPEAVQEVTHEIERRTVSGK